MHSPQTEASPKESMPRPERLSSWLAAEIEHLFGASVSKKPKLTFLESLAAEEGLLTASSLESVYMEILTELGLRDLQKTPIEFLYSVYTKAFQGKRTLPRKDLLYDDKLVVYTTAIDLACSYGLICFQVPDMFLNNDVRAAVAAFAGNQGDMGGFLADIITLAVQQEALLDILNTFLPLLSAQLHKSNLNDPVYSQYLSVYEVLVSQKAVAAVFSQVNGFFPPDETQGLDFEHRSLLGPLLRLSPLVDSVSVYYFGENVKEAGTAQINSTYESLQNEYNVVIGRLFNIVDRLIRGSATTRTDLLVWFSKLVNVSHLRRGSHADYSKLASHGLMFNISAILVRLSLPFLQAPLYSKINKIDLDYFGKSKLLDVAEESRVNASPKDADTYYGEQGPYEANFMTDCFFVALTYFHYGMGGIFIHYDRLKSQIKQTEERVAQFEARGSEGNPMVSHMMRSRLLGVMKSLNSFRSTKHAIQAIFSFKAMHLDFFDFVVGATTVVTRVIDPLHTYPAQKLSIPLFQISSVSQLDDQEFLRTKTPEPWRFYPEYLIEGVINYCKFVTNFRNNPLLFNEEKLSRFIEFSIIMLRCPELLGNPHMKASLIEVLFFGSMPMMDGSPGFMSQIFNTNDLVRRNILYSLLDFYVMVEKTGALSQFYDKFNSRYHISVILEELWKNDFYKHQLSDYCRNNVDFFIRFIARMLNDTTYLLDETFKELNSIHKYQQETKRRQLGQEANAELGTDEELAENLSRSERTAKLYMGLSNKTMELFKLFTKEVPLGFVLPEIVDRLASMLNYNLLIMVGPKCLNLKVESPEKYDFEPKKTLGDLCMVYNNLSNEPKFVVAVARDGRSFKLSYFERAHSILLTRTQLDSKVVNNLLEFGRLAEQQRQNDDDEEMELGEVPDEFLDPLMFTIMEDPVILPSSKVSIDRSTIKSHLLSDGTDPFNRVPLKLEDVVDDVELKEKLQAFKALKRNKDVEMAE